MPEYPVQTSKIQAPPLRDETLARDRLLDWLSVKIHRRVVLLVAEAGYGKTTLLADFTRRTRLRVLWFRLDRGDRDWVGFLAHLVAAIRVHVPDFGQATRALIAETATTAPSLETVLEAFLRELASLTVEPTAFVFDDFHLVDDSPDIRRVVLELLARAPERMSFVFATRREPPIRLARLRALGELAELGTDDLRFDSAETERLFSETYDMRLEPSLLVELNRRTEGWAASLQLVRAALHDRDPGQVRSFISSLSGAEGHLYDYLAEEVIGELPTDLQRFLMRTSVLETVDVRMGAVAGEVSSDESARLIELGEQTGLFSRRVRKQGHAVRAHPLVRAFLRSRLESTEGHVAVAAIHLRVAQAAARIDWMLSAHHFLAAGEIDLAAATLAESMELIMGSGAYSAAEEVASRVGGGLPGMARLLLGSRLAQQQGARAEGLRLAEAAVASDPNSATALLNLVSARSHAGDITGAIEAGHALEKFSETPAASIGRTFRLVVDGSLTGSLEIAAQSVQSLIDTLRSSGTPHYLGVGLLNLSYVQLAMGRADLALASADEAISILGATSRGVDRISAKLARGVALSLLARMREARAEMDECLAQAPAGQHLEVALEIAQMEAFLGDASLGWRPLERYGSNLDPSEDDGEQAIYARALLHARDGAVDLAESERTRLRYGQPRSAVAFEAQRHLLEGLLLTLRGDPRASAALTKGQALSQAQGAHLWLHYGSLLAAAASASASDLSAAVLQASSKMPAAVSMSADILLPRLADLHAEAIEVVVREAQRWPDRWRGPARQAIKAKDNEQVDGAAHLLAIVGESADVRILGEMSKRRRAGGGSRYALELARRLAPPVFVEDLGRVRILVGQRRVEGASVRRRVLALLCLLLTRPQFSSTREEVIDRLWPDHDPDSALNSLNQTAYFLRRVFEPDYHEGSSPGYLGQDGETIWLDTELVDSRSRRCSDLIRAMPTIPTPDESIALATQYEERFALDFAYEEWSAEYRDSLHAAYLRVMEQAIQLDLSGGHFTRGTFLAEHAARVDPDAENVRVALIRLYRMSGAHAAAAESYGRYERVMRDLGVEPIPMSDL